MRMKQLMFGDDANPSGKCLAVHAMLAGEGPLTAWSSDRENLVEGVLVQLDDETRVELCSFMTMESLLRSEALMLRSCKQVALDSEVLPNYNAVLSLVQRFRECAASQQKPRWEQLQNVVLDEREQKSNRLRSYLARRHIAMGPLLLKPLMQTLDGVSSNRIRVFSQTQDKSWRLGGLGGDSEPAVVNFLERCVALALACPPTLIAPTQRNKKRKSSLAKDQEEDTEKEPGSTVVNQDLSLTTLCTLAWDCCSSSSTSSESIAETFPARCETVGHAVAILIAQAPQMCSLYAHSLAAGLPPSGQLHERTIYLKFILLLVGSIRRSLRSRTQVQVQVAEGMGKVTDTRGDKGNGSHSASKEATNNARTSPPAAGSGSLPSADLGALETPLFELCCWAAGELLCGAATEQNYDHDPPVEAAATHRPIHFAVFDAWELPMGSISSTIATDASDCIPAALAEPLAFLQVHLCDPTVPPPAEVALLSDHYQRILLDSDAPSGNPSKKTGTAMGMDVGVGLVPNDWVASVASMVALCPSPRLALAAYRLARALSALVVTVSASANTDAETLQITPSILPTLAQLLPSLRPALVAVQAIKKQLYPCCPELLTRVLVVALSHALSALSLTFAGPSAVQRGKNSNARSSTSSSQPEGLVQAAALSRLPPLLSSVLGTLLHFVSCDEHLVPMTSMLSACTPLCPLPRRLRLVSQVTAECELSTKRVVGCARVLNAAVFLVACSCNGSAITQAAAAVAATGQGSESGQARPQAQSSRGVTVEPVVWFQRLLSASPHAALCLAQSCLLLLAGRWDLGDSEGVFGAHPKEDLELPRWIGGGSLGPDRGSSPAMDLALAQTFERVLRLVVEAGPGVVSAGPHAVNTFAEVGDGAGVAMRAGEGVMGALLHLATQTSAFMNFFAHPAAGAPAHGPSLVRRVEPGEGDPSTLDQNLLWSLVDSHEAAITASASLKGQIGGATGLQAPDGTKHCEDQASDIWPRAESALVSFINAVALARVVGGGGGGGGGAGALPGSMDLSWLLAQVVGRLSCSPISPGLRQLARSFSSRPRRSHLGGLLRAFGVSPASAGAGAIVDGHHGASYSALLYSPLEEEELLPVCGFARIESVAVAGSAPRLLSTVSPFQIDLLLSGGGEAGGVGDGTRDIVSGLGLVAAPSPFLGSCLVCEDWVSLTFAVLHVVKSRLPAPALLLGSGCDDARAGSCSNLTEPALVAVLRAHANKIVLPALAHALRWHLLGLTPARARGCGPASVPHFAFSQIEAAPAPAPAPAPASALAPVSESFLYVLACLEIGAIVSRTCELTQSRLQFKLLEMTWDETLTRAVIAALLCVSELREQEGESVYAKERKQRPELVGVALTRWLGFCSQVEAGAAGAATATGNGSSALPLLSCGSLALATGVLDERPAWRRRLMDTLAVLVPQQSGTLQPQQQGLGLFEVLAPDAPAALHSAVPTLPSFADLWSALNQNHSHSRKQTEQRRPPPPPPALTPVLLQELLLRGLPPVQGEGKGEGQDGEDALAQLMWAALDCCEAGSGPQTFPRWAWALLVELMCAIAYSCTDLPSIGGQGQEYLGGVGEGEGGGGRERGSHRNRGRNSLLSSLCKVLAGSDSDSGCSGSCSVGLLFVPSPAAFAQLVRITCARLSVGLNPPTPPPPLSGTGRVGAGTAMSTSELLVWLATANTRPNPDHAHSNSHSDASEAVNVSAAGGSKHHNWPNFRPGPDGPDPVTPDGDRDRAKGLHALLQSFGGPRLAASPAAVAAAAFSAQATTSRSPILLQLQIQAQSRPSSQSQPQSHQYQVRNSPAPAAVAAVSAAAIAAYYGTEPGLALSERLQDETLAPSLAIQPASGFKRPRGEGVNKSGPSEPPTTQTAPLPAQDLQVTSVALMAQADGLGLEDPDEDMDEDEDEDEDSFAQTLFTAVGTFEAAAAVAVSGLPADLRPSSLPVPLPVPIPAPVPAAPTTVVVPEHDTASAATEAWGLATSDLSKKFGSGSGFF